MTPKVKTFDDGSEWCRFNGDVWPDALAVFTGQDEITMQIGNEKEFSLTRAKLADLLPLLENFARTGTLSGKGK